MQDVLFPLVLIAFFALATLLVRGCEHLIAEPVDNERQSGADLS